MRRLALLSVLGAVALLSSGCSDDEPSRPEQSSRGTEFSVDTERITVKPGEKFSIVVDDNASVGDNWELRTEPEPSIAVSDGDEYVSDSPSGPAGGGGKRYFIFTAKESGDTTIELYNCFRGCESESDKQNSHGHTFDVVVR